MAIEGQTHPQLILCQNSLEFAGIGNGISVILTYSLETEQHGDLVSGRQTVCMQHCFDQLLQNVVTASQGSNVNELGHKRANRRSSEGKALEGDLQRVCVSLIQQYLAEHEPTPRNLRSSKPIRRCTANKSKTASLVTQLAINCDLERVMEQEIASVRASLR